MILRATLLTLPGFRVRNVTLEPDGGRIAERNGQRFPAVSAGRAVLPGRHFEYDLTTTFCALNPPYRRSNLGRAGVGEEATTLAQSAAFVTARQATWGLSHGHG
jgi:hypothetical protein